MALQNYGAIANSMASLQNPVDTFIGAKQGAQQEQRRNAFMQSEVDRRNALTAQEQFSTQQGIQQQELKQALAKIRWMKQSGNLSGQLKASPEKAAQLSQVVGKDLLTLPEEQVAVEFDRLEGHFASLLGEMPKEAPKAPGPEYRTVGDSLLELPTAPGGQPRVAYTAPQKPAAGGTPKPAKPTPAPSSEPANPLPVAALKIVDEANQALAATGESEAIVNRAIAALEGGKVQLGAIRNAESRARNFTGKSDDNSRAFADIQQTLEKLRNNYLLLAKGVQTEGDAQRAWNSEIGENVMNDNKLALQQLKKAKAMLDRATAAQATRIKAVYANFGGTPPSAPVQNDNDPLGIR